jgi:translation initiation factor 1
MVLLPGVPRSVDVSKSSARKVWSSEAGDLRKAQPRPAPAATSVPQAHQAVALHRDRKGRAGKGVTVLRGLALPEAELTALAKTLKQALGVGGTVKNGAIEIQSQEREKIADALTKLGYKVKIAGG